MEITAITYSNDKFRKAAKLNIKTAVKYGKVDRVVKYEPKDIDNEFLTKNQMILEQKKGNGYWLWKPYFIYKSLLEMKENDYLIYTDAGILYMEDVHLLINIMKRDKTDKMFFQMENIRNDASYTKKDAWILMNGDYQKDAFSAQVLAGIILLQNNISNRNLIGEWLEYCCDPRIIMDKKSELGEENMDFITHRHDQSVLSLLLKKYGVDKYRDPSQWGAREHENEFPKDVRDRSTFPQMFNVHRMPNVSNIVQVKLLQTEFMMKVKYKLYLHQIEKNNRVNYDRRMR